MFIHERSRVSCHISYLIKCLIISLYPRMYWHWQVSSILDLLNRAQISVRSYCISLCEEDIQKETLQFCCSVEMNTEFSSEQMHHWGIQKAEVGKQTAHVRVNKPLGHQQNTGAVNIQIELVDLYSISSMRSHDFFILFSRSYFWSNTEKDDFIEILNRLQEKETAYWLGIEITPYRIIQQEKGTLEKNEENKKWSEDNRGGWLLEKR